MAPCSAVIEWAIGHAVLKWRVQRGKCHENFECMEFDFLCGISSKKDALSFIGADVIHVVFMFLLFDTGNRFPEGCPEGYGSVMRLQPEVLQGFAGDEAGSTVHWTGKAENGRAGTSDGAKMKQTAQGFFLLAFRVYQIFLLCCCCNCQMTHILKQFGLIAELFFAGAHQHEPLSQGPNSDVAQR